MNGFTPVLLGKDEPDTGRTVQVFICCNKGGERNLEGNSSFQLLHSQTWGGKRDDFMIGKAQLVTVIAGSARGRGHSHRRGWLEPSSSPWHQLQGQQNRVTRNGEGDTTRARTRLLNSRSSAGAPPREWGGGLATHLDPDCLPHPAQLCPSTRHFPSEAKAIPGGRDCFSFSAFSLSVMTRVYRYRLQRTLNFTLSLFFLILTAAGLRKRSGGQQQAHSNSSLSPQPGG